jgi:LemA protein
LASPKATTCSTNTKQSSQYAQVDSVLQRRADLVPNLTNAVKGSMHNEQKIFGDVAKARSNFNNAKTPADRFKASQDLERSTNVLVNAVRENYPQLNSTKRVHDLMIELEGTENRISTERQNYNRVVQQYNTSVTTFPGSLFHRSTVAYFKADKGAKTAPKVDLDN